MIPIKQNLFSNGILFLLNLLMSIYCLFCFAPSVRCESYLDDSRYLIIHKEQSNSSKDNRIDDSKKLAAEIAGGCTLNLASFLICIKAFSAEGDDPELPGIIVSSALVPLISSLEVTGVGYLVGDKGSWAGALTGAFATVLPGILVTESRSKYDSDAVIYGACIIHTFSPVGAAIGYRLGRPLAKYKCLNYVLGLGVIAYLLYVSAVLS